MLKETSSPTRPSAGPETDTDTVGSAAAGADGSGSTWTVKVAGFALLPAGSCALQVTVVRPIGKVSPEPSGPQAIVRSAAALSGSVAVTSNDTLAPSFEVAVTVWFAGTCSTGAVTSTYSTATVN